MRCVTIVTLFSMMILRGISGIDLVEDIKDPEGRLWSSGDYYCDEEYPLPGQDGEGFESERARLIQEIHNLIETTYKTYGLGNWRNNR